MALRQNAIRTGLVVALTALAAACSPNVHTTVHEYPLEKANEALDDLRAGRFEGAAVLRVAEDAT